MMQKRDINKNEGGRKTKKIVIATILINLIINTWR